MKKRNFALLTLISLFCLVGCKSQMEKEFDRFITSNGIDMSLGLFMATSDEEIDIEFCDILIGDAFIDVSFEYNSAHLITDIKEKKQYFYSDVCEKLTTNYTDESEGISIVYISDIYVENDVLYFYIGGSWPRCTRQRSSPRSSHYNSRRGTGTKSRPRPARWRRIHAGPT